jgi:glycine/D-amino acid oxidase-like deaminating enzyme/nitrite reductase/ring-hydroxylating ferredoxin subunit
MDTETTVDSFLTDKTSGAQISVWLDKNIYVAPRPTFSKLSLDLTTTVCIVGAGITGITAAYCLSREGKRVVLIDDGELFSAESGRTTAHLMSALDDRWFNLQKHHGAEGAKLAYDSHTRAIDFIETIVRQNNIECDFERLDGYLFCGPEHDTKYLQKELTAARESGWSDCELVDNIPNTQNWKSGTALRFPRQAQFNPVKYLNALAQLCVKQGVQIFTHTHASKITGGNPGEVTTSDGFTITCDDIVMATNVPVNDRVTMYTKLMPHRSYAITATIPKGSVPHFLYWDTHDPYHYVRTAPGPDPNTELLIVGGEDHTSGQKHDFEERYNRLIAWTKARFPILNITNRWSGHIIETMDGLAYSGRNPSDHKNVYIHTGDSGTGLTHGTIGAMLISDLILGRNNPWEHLYNPSRILRSDLKEWVTHNLSIQKEYKEWFTGSDVADIEDIPCGQGAVMRHGLKKVAVYRDEKGGFHSCSAVCPHLGGIVNWNRSEKSWDCPVHGSRFDPLGRVIQGPANCNLSKAEEEFAAKKPAPIVAPTIGQNVPVPNVN